MDPFIRLNQAALLKAALAQGLPMDQADEVVQATWEAFFSAVSRFEGRSSIETFLFSILNNKVREHRRYNKRFKSGCCEHLMADSGVVPCSSWIKPPLTPERLAETSETGTRIATCLATLPKSQQQAFYLREVQGEDSSYICDVLGITNIHLGVLIHRAKCGLRLCLGSL